MGDFIKFYVRQDFEIHVPKSFSHYRYIKTIGNGAFSVVVLVKSDRTGELYACKIVSRILLTNEGYFGKFEQELRILQGLVHPNIVRIEDVIFEEELIFVIMEYYPNGELFGYIVSREFLPEHEIKRVFGQIVSTVAYLHEKNISHRDLKPENIVMDENDSPKLIDFGLSKFSIKQQLLSTPCGSPFYAAPEIIGNEHYDGKSADIWSLGVILFAMATGSLPWTEVNRNGLYQQIFNVEFTIPQTVSPAIASTIKRMLIKDPKNRITAKEISNLPWISNTDLLLHFNTYSNKSKPNLVTGRNKNLFGSGLFVNQRKKSTLEIRNIEIKKHLEPISSIIRRAPIPIIKKNVF